ncbi:unnamed protein product [Arctia plantaginis]|uniref:Uncharacterized protein n=1 Tax=Arctia plantaginis TaxID=874455 RepID=A0A8S1AKM3_ARCPL|nr:unnamed protein product [Arctia plantaginis]
MRICDLIYVKNDQKTVIVLNMTCSLLISRVEHNGPPVGVIYRATELCYERILFENGKQFAFVRICIAKRRFGVRVGKAARATALLALAVGKGNGAREPRALHLNRPAPAAPLACSFQITTTNLIQVKQYLQLRPRYVPSLFPFIVMSKLNDNSNHNDIRHYKLSYT